MFIHRKLAAKQLDFIFFFRQTVQAASLAFFTREIDRKQRRADTKDAVKRAREEDLDARTDPFLKFL